jgi:dephospho-CoA kinase
MGKSTAGEFLRQRGVSVIDTDEIARAIVEPGQPALQEIQDTFGGALIGDDGSLQRGELARLVFSDLAARRKLEAILHPRIRTEWLATVETWRSEQRPIGAVIIPLLFETKAETFFDATVCFACSYTTQQARLGSRGWKPEQIQQRRDAQWHIDKKMLLSDYVIWTEGALDVLAEQLRRVFRS